MNRSLRRGATELTAVRRALEQLPLGCGATDTRGRVTWMNAAGAALVGTTPRKAKGTDIRSLWPSAPVRMPRQTETKIEHAVIGGRAVWLRVTRLPVGREVVAVAEDVTALIRSSLATGLIEAAISDPFAIAKTLGLRLLNQPQTRADLAPPRG